MSLIAQRKAASNASTNPHHAGPSNEKQPNAAAAGAPPAKEARQTRSSAALGGPAVAGPAPDPSGGAKPGKTRGRGAAAEQPPARAGAARVGASVPAGAPAARGRRGAGSSADVAAVPDKVTIAFIYVVMYELFAYNA